MIDIPSDAELAARLVLALTLGAVVGFEREVNDQPAGLRTHIGVSLGACLFGVISAYGFTEFGFAPRNDSSFQVDVTRISSEIVTGMGFLGAGAIIKYGPNVRGLTTAASLWVAAAIGLAVAVGSYTLAIVASACVLLSLAVLQLPKRWIERRLAKRHADVVVVKIAESSDPGPVVAAFAELEGIGIEALEVDRSEVGVAISLRVRKRRREDLAALIAPIANRRDVLSMEAG